VRHRRRAGRLYPRTLGPRDLEALRLVQERPGLTTAELAGLLGVSRNRAAQIVRRLEAGRVRRER
jgi:DNA-binding MarR family transcriptional regulator